MECRAEINRFAIFLFCLLVPLGSMAPTERSERKMTTGQRQDNFTPEIPTLAVVIQQKAHALFDFYNKCISATFHAEHWRGTPKGGDTIPRCPVFQGNCCALHHIRNTLAALRGPIETICSPSSTELVEANLSQLNTTLSQGTAFFTCSSPPQEEPQGQTMSLADKKTYIWQVLKKYRDIMQFTRDLYTGAAV